jgi:hypothetical protein
MPGRVARSWLAVVFLILAPPSFAQERADSNTETAELIGAPVFAADGAEVGEVVDLSFDDEGQPQRLKMKAAAHLGLGARTIEVPQGAFIALRGAVVLDMPAAAVQVLPELTERNQED